MLTDLVENSEAYEAGAIETRFGLSGLHGFLKPHIFIILLSDIILSYLINFTRRLA